MSVLMSRARRGLLMVAVIIATGVAVNWTVQAQSLSLRIPKVTQPLRLEDYLGGAPRNEEVRVADFRQREPGDGAPASQPTEAYLSYDDKNLYVVFVCKDQPDNVRARLSRREEISGDDHVVVLLDTFHDRQRAYLFAANPLGIQLDGVVTEGQEDDFSFDTLWHSDGRLTDDGFVVWMSIPFKSLRFPGTSQQKWGIAVGRITPQRNEESYWPHISSRVEGVVQQLAVLEGIEEISPGRNIQLIPYGTLARARFLDRPDEGASQFRT